MLSQLERDLELRCNRLIRMSLVISIVLFLVLAITAYNYYTREKERNRLIISPDEVGYYMRCYQQQEKCGPLGICQNVTIITPTNDYQDSICLTKEDADRI